MNQTTIIFGAVAFAFLFYVTVKGDLAKWLGLLGLAQTALASSATPPTSNGLPALPALPSLQSILTAPASLTGNSGLLGGGT